MKPKIQIPIKKKKKLKLREKERRGEALLRGQEWEGFCREKKVYLG